VTRAGTVADHVIPHKGNRALFFDPRNLQTLCKEHHDGVKQSWEKRGTPEIGLDGWPVAPSSTVH
jgi:5-methylcytosine-specific restriction endonuclease McrA